MILILAILITACTLLVCWNVQTVYNNLQSDIYELLFKIDIILDQVQKEGKK